MKVVFKNIKFRIFVILNDALLEIAI